MRDHLSAIAALIPDGIDVYDTEAERPDYDPADWSASWSATQRAAWSLPDRYVILSAPTLPSDAMTVDGSRRHVDGNVRVKAVGTSARQARWVQEAVRAVLDPGAPAVDGYGCDIRLRIAGDLYPDTEVTPHRVHSTDVYRYRATPA